MYFHAVKIQATQSFLYTSVFVVVILLVSGRYLVGGSDFSYFFVAGTDFVDGSKTPEPIVVNEGQGYDGQFFYRYALAPFNFSKTAYGITVDHVSYRMQRIGYPLLVWIASLGGRPSLVPFSLVLVNLFAFVGIFYFTSKLINYFKASEEFIFLPFLLCGIYMSIAKDLSEVTELFFFIGSIFYFFKKSFFQFVLFASATILCRETALIAYIPLAGFVAFKQLNEKKINLNSLWMIIPFITFILWRTIIHEQVDAATIISGSNNIGIPFLGIIQGFLGNLDISTTKNKLQLAFWIIYFVWQIWLAIKVVTTILNDPKSLYQPLVWVYCTWALFALVLSAAIYIDDWSFVRVFSLWNMTGFLILIASGIKSGKYFNFYSLIMVLLTLGRLIIRP